MPERKIKRALISVHDKTGIVEFARGLVELGIEIISTGGTAALLKENTVPVTLVEEITGFPEMLDGRVKTLHPKIHAAILADRDNPEHMRQLAEQGIEPIDMVVVNLYPFKETVADPDCTFEQAIEMIDIGGPCLLRAAAKNHKHVLVVEGAGLYDITLRQLRGEPEYCSHDDFLRSGAFGAFWATSRYDAAITQWLGFNEDEQESDVHLLQLWCEGRLRYGENPHQKGLLYGSVDGDRPNDLTAADTDLEGQQNKTSYNNYADAHAALELCGELSRGWSEASACVFIKHTNACGAAVAENRVQAYQQAFLGDHNAAMGGILACNFEVDAGFAGTVMDTYAKWGKAAGAGGFFVEVWVAPAFEERAIEVIRKAKAWGKRVRLLAVEDLGKPFDPDPELEYKSISGGMLVQSRDLVGLNEDEWKTVTKRAPTNQELDDLRLAWLVCKHTKSNAISICKDGMLIGNGAGQMSRVMSCRIATWLAKENGHADQLAGAVAASDAFFPFRDGPDLLIEAGVKAIIQPGGSKRDAETIAACDEQDVAMIFTGTRHFKH
ncbi:MAG: bifunctional phosphoribosylaminoimidazolecarboxamide formyltransferase/IMP cyclohydrolase [Planctomycetes bacterium]|nr:bifunctional phosphoribosylaminoimidazolecarboxamide formyltransferase/IMP cyclohydrolase [Planctomycetota bacterium]